MKELYSYLYKKGAAYALIIDKLLRTIILFFFGLLLAKVLGANDYGIYSSQLAIVSMWSAVALFGVEAISLRQFALNKSSIFGAYFLTSVIFRLITGLLAVVCIYLYSLLIVGKVEPIFMACVSIYFLSYSLYISEYYFKAKVKVKVLILSSFIQLSISSIIKIYGAITSKGISYFLASFAFDIFLYGIVVTVIFLHNNCKLKFRLDFTILKDLFFKALPLLVSGLCMGVYRNYDLVILSQKLNAEIVGNYALCLKLISGCYIIPVIICNIKLKDMMNKNTTEEYYSALFRLFFILFVFSIAIYFLYLLIVHLVVEFIFMDGYSLVKDMSWFVGMYIFVIAFDTWVQNHCINKGLRTELVVYSIVICVLVILFNSIFIPFIGYFGTILALIISYPLAIILNIFMPNWRKEVVQMLSSFDTLILERVKKK